jgi:tetratricopeptide (TPR) repeat protein
MDDVFARYQAALRTGHQLAAEGRFKDALTHYEEAAQVAEKRALPQVCIGGMHLRLGRPKEALEAYDRALELEPDDLDAMTGRAAALLAAGRRAEAADAQQQIVARQAGPPQPPPASADMRTALSRAETLAVAGDQALDAGQTDAAIDAWLAESEEQLEGQRYDAAIDAALRVLTLDTGSMRAHLQLTRIYFRRGWRPEALERIALMRKLLDLAPDPETTAGVDEFARRHLAS